MIYLRNAKLYLILSLLIIVIIVFSYYVVDYFMIPPAHQVSEQVPLIIPKGASVSSIADSLLKKELIDDKELFMLWLTSLNKDRSMKAGFYEVPKNLTYAQLISFLSQAHSKEIRVTLIEGWRVEEIASELADKLGLNKDELIRLSSDSLFIRELGLQISHLEGYLLPDTYHFYWGINEKRVLRFLVAQTLELFTTDVRKQLIDLKMTRHQILTLASIIEGEVIFDDERQIVSSVYHNRLRRRIKLQADPTIQYILDGPPRRLLLKDLQIESPYNTYKYYGLPPGPISNPGEKSIYAALYPAETDYIYFVAKGDGRHTFSKTASEHRKAKAKFDKIRREVSRKQRAAKQ